VVFVAPSQRAVLQAAVCTEPALQHPGLALAHMLNAEVALPDTCAVDGGITAGVVASARGAAGLHLLLQHGQGEEHPVLAAVLAQLLEACDLRPDAATAAEEDEEEPVVAWTQGGREARFRYREANARDQRCVLVLFGTPAGVQSARRAVLALEVAEGVCSCCVCFGRFDARSGLRCDSAAAPHFACTACFEGMVRCACDMENLLAGNGGAESIEVHVLCPYKLQNQCDDSGPFDMQTVAKVCSTETWAAVNAANAALLECKVLRRVEAENKAALERERLRKMVSLQEEEVRVRYNHVVDKIFNLRCPRCEAPFYDFTGCFALTCSRCPCGFCALCLKDCGADAHTHVAQCGVGRLHGTYYGTIEQFIEVHRQRRESELQAYLGAVGNTDVFNQLRERLVPDARDLGITLPPRRAKP